MAGSARRFACVWRVLAALALPVLALAGDAPSAAARVPRPVIEPARGDKCVADKAVMRREHMIMLKHQRDETVHGGVRGAAGSLKACIGCHASKTTGSVSASAGDFCVSCHSYSAVRIDCFECHSGKPAPAAPGATPVKGRKP